MPFLHELSPFEILLIKLRGAPTYEFSSSPKPSGLGQKLVLTRFSINNGTFIHPRSGMALSQ